MFPNGLLQSHMHNIPVEGAVKQINRVLDTGTPEELMQWLQKPEGLLPVVDASRPNLYMDNLRKARQDKGAVS